MNGGIIGKACRGRGVYTIGDHLLNTGRSRIPERAVTFDGTDDYASLGCASFGAALATGTAEMWLKTTTTGAVTVMGAYNDGFTTSFAIMLNIDHAGSVDAGKIYIQIRDNNAKNVEGNTAYSVNFYDGLWHHLAVAWACSTNTLYAYVDGIGIPFTYKQQTTPVSFSNFQYALPAGCVNKRGTMETFFPGTIDEPRLWSDVRTLSEIREYMRKRVVGTEGNLYGAWHMNEGHGTALADVKGNNNGTLNGGTWIDAADVTWWDEAAA